jgi:crossover junction endodeoxyribonuclease RuvC
VDPGSVVTGWGVVERRGASAVHVAHGTVRPTARAALPARLAAIHRALVELCASHRPDVLALEKSFVGKNIQSAFRLGEVRGVALLVAATAGLPVAEYAPAEVKLAIAGGGRAEKEQVGRAVARELALVGALAADAADALAIALCHLHCARMQALGAAPRRVAG